MNWREQVGIVKRKAYANEAYWAKPVPGFGDPDAEVMILGLAPGAHGSNRTGRMFTGDASGDFLFPALYRAGFSSQPLSVSGEDSLELHNIFITAVCRCVPPQNRPDPQEVRSCRDYLMHEYHLLKNIKGIVALGRFAYDASIQILKENGTPLSIPNFGHGVEVTAVSGLPWVIASYHPSRQNTQTGKLTVQMFDHIWTSVKGKLLI